jgi:hypothetical protein
MRAMSSPTGPTSGLPVRMPRPRKPGRHRKPELLAAPVDAPPLVLAVPGAPGAGVRRLAEEILSIARSELPGLDARIGCVDGGDEEFPQLTAVLGRAAEERREAVRRAAQARLAAAAGGEGSTESGEQAEFPADVRPGGPAAGDPGEGPVAVVVPLLAGPDHTVTGRIRQAIADSGATAELTDALGPHPLLAEALHVRLSEVGLARADRARLFTVATAADGIILGTVGGEEAAQAAGITGMLLSARLALPVLTASLEEHGGVVRAAEQLRAAGSAQLALAPCVIGPEAPDGLIARAAEEAGCPAAEAIGAYTTVGKLVLATYATVLGIALQPALALR